MELTIINKETNNSIIFDNKNFIINNFSSDKTTVNHDTSQTIKQIGEYIISSSVSSRQIDLIGYIIGESKLDLELKKSKLINIINPLQNIDLIVNNNKKITVKALSTVQWGAKWENNNNKFCKFVISFLAPSTLWEDLEPSIVTFSPWENEFIFPFSIPSIGMIFGHKVQDKYTTIFNENNISLGCTFTLTSLAKVVNPTIINVVTGEKMKLNITIQPKDEVIIETKFDSKKITLNGNNAINIFDFLNSEWLMINPGENTFTYTTENNADDDLNIQLEFYNSYWGIV